MDSKTCVHGRPSTAECEYCSLATGERFPLVRPAGNPPASPPASPPAPTLDFAAAVRHESFMAYVRAGFTRAEALSLIQSDATLGVLLSQGQMPQDGAE